ncbi:DUF881 domain-containing protein [Actinopolymorpha cephalotaxi]|uniref:Uncharacterized protein YlxW (UPF0749 family) n=1 Tax=Actinopolymorpha cephalotaxi TaxID=504797 RepID=A0ABX2RZL8_9ACTN|nr:DUF881 domain-containing protein [Actinopolymorpha cephalotaxi]NYH82795.1 uncharacterized protein YlxW (UPF0749 family) [Actinopolymorpha cephalotaxi]
MTSTADGKKFPAGSDRSANGRTGAWTDSYPEFRRNDSMSLMRELVTHALDDGYAAAAARRGPNRSRPRRGMGATVVVLVVFGLMLAVAAVQTRHFAPEVEKEKADLIVRIRAEAARNDRLRARANALQEEVSGLQSDILASTTTGQDLSARLDALDVIAGTGRVRGPGLRLTIDDAPDDQVSGSDGAEGRILDIDLQQTVNGLWAAGAEAVSVNGERLTAMTAIRGADKSITVDYRPLARPYVVEAIGDPNALEARFTESPGGEWLLNLKAVQHIRLDTKTVDELSLPADSGTTLRYARTEGAQ